MRNVESLNEEEPLMKSSKGGTVDSDVKTMLAGVANALVAATYVEDAFRTLSDWKGQYEYIVGNTGFVPAGWLLVAITAIQVSSVAIVVPASCCPQMAKPIIGVCCALGLTVLLQPLLYNLLELSQNVTILLVCMAFAQLGALGLIICESHKVDVASKAASSRSTTKYEEEPLFSWIQLVSRFLITIDLVCVTMYRLYTVLLVSQEEKGTQSLGMHFKLVTPLAFIVVIMVWLGYKTAYVALMAAFTTFVEAFIRFPFWADVAGKGSDYTDFMRFHFFQAMTPVGGFLLVAICGPGKLSLDKKD